LSRLSAGPFARAFENLGHCAFAQNDAVKIAHRLDYALITQMLLVIVKDHGRFQIRLEVAFGFRPFSQGCAIGP
jgi:hypothetical protein